MRVLSSEELLFVSGGVETNPEIVPEPVDPVTGRLKGNNGFGNGGGDGVPGRSDFQDLTR